MMLKQAAYEKAYPDRSSVELGDDPDRPRWNLAQREPTFAHRAISKLVHQGLVRMVMTANFDNLHRMAGLNEQNLVELQGNHFFKRCNLCDACYQRSAMPPRSQSISVQNENALRVETYSCKYCGGRGVLEAEKHSCQYCELCGGKGVLQADPCEHCAGQLTVWSPAMYANGKIIMDAEGRCILPYKDTALAEQTLSQADFCLVLGYTFSERPVADYFSMVGKRAKEGETGGKLFIINLQKTKYDNLAQQVIHTFCDDAMARLMHLLDEGNGGTSIGGSCSGSTSSTDVLLSDQEI